MTGYRLGQESCFQAQLSLLLENGEHANHNNIDAGCCHATFGAGCYDIRVVNRRTGWKRQDLLRLLERLLEL